MKLGPLYLYAKKAKKGFFDGFGLEIHLGCHGRGYSKFKRKMKALRKKLKNEVPRQVRR